MIKFGHVLLFAVLASSTKAVSYCTDNFTLSQLPEGILVQSLSLIIQGTIQQFLGCGDENVVPKSDVNFWYYSRSNPKVPILLNQSDTEGIDPNKNTIVLIHGWLCNVTDDRIPELKQAYLARYDANVIAIDWSSRSVDLYTASYCAVPKIAGIIAEFLCTAPNIDVSRVHVVGHGMGAQLSGLTGQQVQVQCNKKIPRVSALDPAGPIYQGQSSANRLDANDATMVDVIHSNMGFLGYYGTCGSVDFYPNCGTYQPGCLGINSMTTISQIINLPTTVVFCNQYRSIDYFIESISSNNFLAKSCLLCNSVPLICMADVLLATYTKMGEDCPIAPTGKFYLPTNSASPFARG